MDGSVNDTSNSRLLCPTCHSGVTLQPRRPSNPLLSHFNLNTYRGIVESGLPPLMIQKFKKIDERVPTVYVDIRACRRAPLS